MPRIDAAMRRRSGLGALAAASMLLLLPAVAPFGHLMLVLTLYSVLLLGGAAVLVLPTRRAVVAGLARRAAEPAREVLAALAPAASGLRWIAFPCLVFYAAGAARKAASRGETISVGKLSVLLQFVGFVVAIWTVSLSLITARGPAAPPPPPPAAATVEEEHDGGAVDGGTAAPAARGVVGSSVQRV